MMQEILSAPNLIQNQIKSNDSVYQEIAKILQRNKWNFSATIARGSSDHCSSFFSYLLGLKTNIFCGSLPPSLLSIHESAISFNNSLVFGVSQSGASPDIIKALEQSKKMGANTISFINEKESKLEQISNYTIPLGAGLEESVPATKSFLSTLTAMVSLVAKWCNDSELSYSLEKLPEALSKSFEIDFEPLLKECQNIEKMIILGRGLGYGIASEASLKINETCKIQTSPYSAVEFKHGPITLVNKGDPVIVFISDGKEKASILDMCRNLVSYGAKVFTIGASEPISGTISIRTNSVGNSIVDLITAIGAFYPFAEKLSNSRGLNPDMPEHLKKVTKTL